MAADGRIVLAWEDWSASRYDVAYRRFSLIGAPAGPSARVGPSLPDVGFLRRNPAIVVHPDGRFVIAWDRNETTDPADYNVRMRRFAADGSPDGEGQRE
ncbi:MAG: hypothetical protein FJ087_17980 [Deltaproteobacteria bacterium]|nr:hypothetical protein [Deltaproteobacteria bacterium]